MQNKDIKNQLPGCEQITDQTQISWLTSKQTVPCNSTEQD